MNIKMIATDLDGTLLRSDSTISDYTYSILEKCRANGIKVTYATARSNSGKIPTLDELVDGYVYNNGAKAYVGETLVYNKVISIADVRGLLVAADKAGIKIAAESNGVYYGNFDITKELTFPYPIQSRENINFNTIDIEVEKIIAAPESADKSTEAADLINNHLPEDACLLIREEGLLMVVIHKEAIKSKGVAALAEYWGIKQSETAAFGDDTIDIDLLEYCGIGVAVSNALDEVKASADYVCESNDNDGVAKWIEGYLS